MMQRYFTLTVNVIVKESYKKYFYLERSEKDGDRHEEKSKRCFL